MKTKVLIIGAVATPPYSRADGRWHSQAVTAPAGLGPRSCKDTAPAAWVRA